METIMELGAKEKTTQNVKFIGLRTGYLSETSKEPKSGFLPATTKNKSGTEYHFFAKNYEEIVGYITDVRWHSHELPEGGSIDGWNITIDTTKDVFVFGLMSKDKPYTRGMSVLLNIDFTQPVRFVAFLDKRGTSPKKVLLMYQDGEKPVQPKFAEKWLSRELMARLKDLKENPKTALPLDERDEKNIERDEKGVPDNSYPYIRQNLDKKWSFDAWTNFLMEQVTDNVLPAVEAANNARPAFERQPSNDVIEDDDNYNGDVDMDNAPMASDDEIPF